MRPSKGSAKLIILLLLAVIGGAVAAIIVAKLQTGPAEADLELANEKATSAEERLAIAEAAERQFQREALLEHLLRLRLTPHRISWNASKCWSDQAWELVSQVAALGSDDNLRNEATATLIGLDARLIKPFREMSASSVAFDVQGKRLLIGGAPAYKQYPAEGAKVWDSETKVIVHVANHKTSGPVAFEPNGAPLQLVIQEGPSLLLWDVAKQTGVTKFEFNPEQTRVVQWALNGHGFPLLAMTKDGSLVAAAAITADDKRVLAVWQGSSGKRLFQIPARATALAFSPEGKYLATGDEQGKITLWPVTEEGELEYIQGSLRTIQSLAFSPDSRHFAAGDASGTIHIWELRTKLPPVSCTGPYDEVLALSFSPDGTLLASGGRNSAKLWDAATGRLLLEILCEDVVTGLAFASDGRKLAVSSRSEFSQGGVSIWNLNYGRGIQILVGLSRPASRLCFSPDGRFLAARGLDGPVAIWNLETGLLARTLDVPHAGPAGMAFCPDAKRFVFSAGRLAKSWDISTGKESGAWDLPKGVLNVLAFHRTGKLLLFRVEKKDNHPVCLVRSLAEPGTMETIAEIKELNREISDAQAPLDGDYLVVEAKPSGRTGETPVPPMEAVLPVGRVSRPSHPGFIEAFDLLTGRKIWPLRETEYVLGSHLQVDPTGKKFAFRAEDRTIKLVEMPAGRLVDFPDADLVALGPGGQLCVEPYFAFPRGYSLFHFGERTPLLTLGIDSNPGRSGGSPVSSNSVEFDRAGRQLAWANPDGTVTLCDLEKIHKKLAEVGLGW